MRLRRRNRWFWGLAPATALALNASILAYGAADAAAPPAGKRGGPRKAPSEHGRAVVPGPGGIRLVLNLKPDGVSVVTAMPLATPRKDPHAPPPIFATDKAGTLPLGTSEYIVALYDQRGRILESFGLPGRPSRFEDEVIPGSGGQLRTRWLRPPMDIRTVDVRSRAGLSFVGIFRATRGRPPSGPRPGESRRRTMPGGVERDGIWLEELGIYDLRPDPDADSGQRPHIFLSPLAKFPPIDHEKKWLGHIPFHYCIGPSGTYLSTTRLLDSGDPDQKYDIVILGDGFTAAELGKFDTFASRYKNALLSMEPFASLAGKINIRTVRTASTDSGVSNCPGNDRRNTYYHVSGKWFDVLGVQGGPGYFGVEDWCAVYDSLDKAGESESFELIVMIANCDIYGGDAEPDNQIAFLPTDSRLLANKTLTFHSKDGHRLLHSIQLTSDAGQFEGLAPHESAHAIAHLVEEYAACIADDPTRPHPNIERAPNHLAPWWKSLANADELDSVTNSFVAVHTCSDALDSTDCHGNGGCCDPIATLPATTDMLGAWWGAQYGDPGGTSNPDCDPFCDDAGNQMPMSCEWFRPQATCRMRHLRSDFCRACVKLLTDAITAHAP